MSKKRGKSVKININLSNRWLYTLILIGILAAVCVGIYAYGTTSPSSFGHSMGELAPPASCASNQFLKWNGASWVCGDTILAPPSPCASGQFLKWGGSSWTCSNVAIPTYPVYSCSNIVGASNNVLGIPATLTKMKEVRVHGNGTATFFWEVKNDPNSDYIHIDLYKNDVLVGLQYKYCYSTSSCTESGHTTRQISQNVWYADSETLNVNDGDRITIYSKAISGVGASVQLRNFRVGYCLSAIPAEVVFDSTPIDWEE